MAKTIDLHVDFAGGLDTNDGSVGSPFKTYQKAIDTAVAGTVIGLGNNASHVLTAPADWTTVGGVPSDNAPILTTTWDNAGTGDRAYIDCNGGAFGIWLNPIARTDLDYISAGNNSGSNYILNLAAAQYITITRCDFTQSCQGGISGTGAVTRISDTKATCSDVTLFAITIASTGGTVINCIAKHTGAHTNGVLHLSGFYVTGYGNVVYSASGTATGAGVEYISTSDHGSLFNNTIIGTGQAGTGLLIAAGAINAIVSGNIIQNFATGIDYGNQVSRYMGNNVIYNCTSATANVPANWEPNITEDTTTNPLIVDAVNGDYRIRATGLLGALYNLNVNFGADQDNDTGSGGAPTAEENATAVLEKLLADHSSVAGSLAERMTRIPNVAPASAGGLGTVNASNQIAGIAGTVANTLDDIGGAAYDPSFALDQTATLAQQYDEIKKLFDTETWPELTGVPAAQPTTMDALMWIYMMARNALTDDRLSGQQTVTNDVGGTIGTAVRSDDGDAFTRNKFTSS